jgi:hypothetical protein
MVRPTMTEGNVTVCGRDGCESAALLFHYQLYRALLFGIVSFM